MDNVRCYGCGQQYQPTEQASQEHCHHGGDIGIPRWQIMKWLDECQAERDQLARLVPATVEPGPLALVALDRWLADRRRNVTDNL